MICIKCGLAKKADMRELLETTGSLNLGFQFANLLTQQTAQQIRSLRPDIPEEFFEILNQEMEILMREKMDEPGGLIDMLIQIYHEYYNHEEIKGLLEFYQTDLGAKTIRIMPQLMQEGSEAGQQWAQSLVPELRQIIQRRLKEEGIELPE